MARRPRDQLDVGRRFYADRLPDLDSAHFGPLWYFFTVGHLIATDLDEVAGTLGCSFADLDLLGTLAIDEPKALRATDLASALYVSDAVVSTRIARLERSGLIERTRAVQDRRAFELKLTPSGRALIEKALHRIAQRSKLVRFLRQLAPEDQQALTRILGDLHHRFDREFEGGPYLDP